MLRKQTNTPRTSVARRGPERAERTVSAAVWPCEATAAIDRQGSKWADEGPITHEGYYSTTGLPGTPGYWRYLTTTCPRSRPIPRPPSCGAEKGLVSLKEPLFSRKKPEMRIARRSGSIDRTIDLAGWTDASCTHPHLHPRPPPPPHTHTNTHPFRSLCAFEQNSACAAPPVYSAHERARYGACVCAFGSVCARVRVCVCVHVRVCMCVCTDVCVCLCVCLCVWVRRAPCGREASG
jgi:hypothetical protein